MTIEAELARLTIQRTARKAYRCAGADEVLGWGVRTRHEACPADREWSGWSSMPNREAAEARASVLVGSRAGGMPGHEYHYTAAEAVPTMNPQYRPDCLGDIKPGDRYVEDRMDAMPWESGQRYCQRCGERLTDDRL